MSCRWKEISAEERATYENLATEDKARYKTELAAWEAEHGQSEKVLPNVSSPGAPSAGPTAGSQQAQAPTLALTLLNP